MDSTRGLKTRDQPRAGAFPAFTTQGEGTRGTETFSALANLVPGIDFVDDVDTAFAAHNLASGMPGLGGSQRR